VRAFRLILLALLTLVPLPAGGQDASSPTEPPVRFRAWTGREVQFTSESDHQQNVGGVEVDGPLVIGGRELARLVVALELRAIPGQAAQDLEHSETPGSAADPIDIGAPETWGRDAEVHVALARRVGELEAGDQRVTTSVMVRAGWATALGQQILDHYPGDWGAGLRVAEERSGAFAVLLGGRHALAGGWCVQVFGAFPLVRAGAGPWAVAIGGDAYLGARTVMRLNVGVRR